MEMDRPTKHSREEEMMRKFRIAMMGRDVQGRCGPMSDAQQSQVEEAAIEMIMESMHLEREAARDVYQKVMEGR